MDYSTGISFKNSFIYQGKEISVKIGKQQQYALKYNSKALHGYLKCVMLHNKDG